MTWQEWALAALIGVIAGGITWMLCDAHMDDE